MNTPIRFICFTTALLLILFAWVHAGEVTIPNTFESGTPAVAAEVNENFSAMETAVDDNDSRIATLEASLAALQATNTAQADTIAALQSRLEILETSEVMALDDYLLVDETGDSRGTQIRISGANLQIVNGLGSTDTINGLGNLIVGYDERTTLYSLCCSDGAYTDQASCEGAGETWSHSHKTGSHYLVTGFGNNYSQYGGMVGGRRNYATGPYSTVTGGDRNRANGSFSSISGGAGNTASGDRSSVSGGLENTAAGLTSNVSGGRWGHADGENSNISGGLRNQANGRDSSVSGGNQNVADGNMSSVSGGYFRTVTGENDWAAGSLFEDR